MSTEIVKYHNDMASVSLPGLSPTEHDIFSAVLYECKDKGTEKHPIDEDTLKKLIGYTSKDNKRFYAYLDNLTDKLLDLRYKKKYSDGGFEKFNLFTSFKTQKNETTGKIDLMVGVSSDFAYILNSKPEYFPDGVLPLLSGGYTTYELNQLTALVSTYSKMAFRQLKRFKRTGWWQVSVEEFKRLLDVPESYRLSDVRRRVLAPVMEELHVYFEDLSIEEIKGRGANGRKATVAFKFTFKPQQEAGVWYENDTKAVLRDEYKCPFCGKPLYAIIKKGGTIFYGHKDGWKSTAACKHTFGSLEEILGINGDAVKAAVDLDNDADEDHEDRIKPEKSGFICRECGRPLYILHNERGEAFYGHLDGWKKDAPCRRTYSSVAEIRGYSETPTRFDHADYELEEKSESGGQIDIYSIFETIKNNS